MKSWNAHFRVLINSCWQLDTMLMRYISRNNSFKVPILLITSKIIWLHIYAYGPIFLLCLVTFKCLNTCMTYYVVVPMIVEDVNNSFTAIEHQIIFNINLYFRLINVCGLKIASYGSADHWLVWYNYAISVNTNVLFRLQSSYMCSISEFLSFYFWGASWCAW